MQAVHRSSLVLLAISIAILPAGCGSGSSSVATCDPVCEAGYACAGETCVDVDECQTSEVECIPEARCINTEGSYECVCDPGYMGDGANCTDVDECSEGIHDCGSLATCRNLPGTYSCHCPAGYVEDGRMCFDVDECAEQTATCGLNATCQNLTGAYLCVCDEGFEGDGQTCFDVDECSLDDYTCPPNSACENTPGAYDCICDAGFEDDGFTCADIDECALGLLDCDPIATCENAPGTYTCVCPPGYDGDGANCTDVDECSEQAIDCGFNGVCVNDPGSYHCQCDPGYEMIDNVCSDMDECYLGTHTCHADAQCIDLPGTFSCACNVGFAGDGNTCTDIDECTDNGIDCGPDGECINEPGYYYCDCDPGYEAVADVCQDIDECADNSHTCALVGSECTNTPGSFDCACLIGFTGDGHTCTADFGDYSCRQQIQIGGLDADVVDGELLLTLDTQALILDGKLQPDCRDLRFMDSDAVTPLEHWIEGGCNTTYTQVWVLIPTAPMAGSSIYLYYCEPGATDAQLAFPGHFILPSSEMCQAPWSYAAELHGRLPRGSDTYGGTGGGDHQHSFTCSAQQAGDISDFVPDGNGVSAASQGHTHPPFDVPLQAMDDLLPPSLSVPFCQTADLSLPAGMIGLFLESNPAWQAIAELDGRFPFGDFAYGVQLGSSTHFHTSPPFMSSPSLLEDVGYDLWIWGQPASLEGHDHVVDSEDSDPASHVPPYYDLLFAKRAQAGPAAVNGLVMGSAVPPLGWSQLGQLQDRYVRAGDVPGLAGGTSSHAHFVELVLYSDFIGVPIDDMPGWPAANYTHTHVCNGMSNQSSHLPPYLDVLFLQKHTGLLSPAMSLTFGQEETF